MTNTTPSRKWERIALIIMILVVAGLLYYIVRSKKNEELDSAVKQRDQTGMTIDSTKGEITTIIEDAAKNSQSSADEGNKLIKKLPKDEKTIPDTSYAAMCDYITNYRPR